jgi:3-hydroxyisobutyrate dehydrogenase
MNVGYIGLGAMGGALARRLLLSRGVVVYDRSPQAMAAAVELGATTAETPAAMARRCDLVMICVPRSANVQAIIFGPDGLTGGLSDGKFVIDQTSGDPAETRRMAAELSVMNARMLDAPVSGGPRGAQAGTIAIMVGGNQEDYQAVLPVLHAISPNVTRCGGIGSGQVLKLVNNTISICNRFAMLEAVAVGLKNGLELEVMAEVLNQGGARSRVTEHLLPALAKGVRSADFALALMLKDLNLAMRMAADSGAPLLFGQLARGLLQSTANACGPDANLDAIAPYIAAQAGISFRPGEH